MPLNPHKLDLFWRRLEDAKLQLDFTHNYVKEVQQDKLSGDIPAPDGFYAHKDALRNEEDAVTRYLTALRAFQAALVSERGTGGVEESATEKTLFSSYSHITPREREVLKLIASGKSSKEIAEHLGIAFRTVVCHRYRVQTKLNIHNTADLTRAAMRMGLIEL